MYYHPKQPRSIQSHAMHRGMLSRVCDPDRQQKRQVNKALDSSLQAVGRLSLKRDNESGRMQSDWWRLPHFPPSGAVILLVKLRYYHNSPLFHLPVMQEALPRCSWYHLLLSCHAECCSSLSPWAPENACSAMTKHPYTAPGSEARGWQNELLHPHIWQQGKPATDSWTFSESIRFHCDAGRLFCRLNVLHLRARPTFALPLVYSVASDGTRDTTLRTARMWRDLYLNTWHKKHWQPCRRLI